MKSAKCIRRRRTINRTVSYNLQKKENEQTKDQIQTKLRVGQPNDKYKQESYSAANQVMRIPDSVTNIQQQCEGCEEKDSIKTKPIAASISPWIQTQTVKEEEEMLQPKWIQKAGCSNCGEQEMPEVQTSTRTIQMSPLSHIESRSGQALPHSSRGFFEPRFGHSFNNVKVHTCDSAVQMNQQLGAQAFTYGNNIFFNKGKYNPESNSGKHLLAHELTHVMQQTKNPSFLEKRIQRQPDKPEWKKAEEKFKKVVVSLDPKKPKSNSEKFKSAVDKTLETIGKKKLQDSIFKKLKLNPKGKKLLSILGMSGYGLFALSKKKIPAFSFDFKLKPNTWLTVSTGGDFKKPKAMIGLKIKFRGL